MTPVTLHDTLRIPERITFRRVRDEMALLNLETGVYFGLDEVGARMWELLAEHHNLQAVAERMEAEYDVAPAQLRKDLLRLTQELIAKGLIEVG
jgi:Coenzyme PQQ synthesis protein D (PqqD)